MDGQRFDELTRTLVRRASRRTVIRGAVGGAAAAFVVRSNALAGTVECTEGLTACGDVCVDLQTDLGNCGECDSICDSDLVAVACVDGVCIRTDCAAAQLSCDGACIDPMSDPANCGACGAVCDSGTCAAGACAAVTECAEGQLVCDGVCIDGCCNNDNCGACGNVCTGGLTCFEGICDCPSGDCDDTPPTPAPTATPVTPTLPSTGSGPTDGAPDSAIGPVAVAAAAAAIGLAALRRLLPRNQPS